MDSNIVTGNINTWKEKKHSRNTCLWLAPRPWDMGSKIGDNRLEHMSVSGFKKNVKKYFERVIYLKYCFKCKLVFKLKYTQTLEISKTAGVSFIV